MSSIFVISAPSGSGKSSLLRNVLAKDRELLFSVSYTTRQPRGAEREGVEYHFVSREEFEKRIEAGEFLEWALVFGHYYGTHRSYLDRASREGKDLVLDIDVQGARQLINKVPDAISIFVLAPSRQVLEQRLRGRSEDSDAAVIARLKQAAEEARQYRNYDYVIVNDDLDRATGQLAAVVTAERCRRERTAARIGPILESFDIQE